MTADTIPDYAQDGWNPEGIAMDNDQQSKNAEPTGDQSSPTPTYAAPTDADWNKAGRIISESFGLQYKIAEALAAERAKAEGK